MDNAVFGAIAENMKVIELIFEPTHPAFRKDRKQTGDSREITVKEFIESFLPSSFICEKGPIFSSCDQSNEIDCVIKAPNHPKLITPKRNVILAEGVYAAIEVKPDISTLQEKSEFRRALMQIQSVKKLKRMRHGGKYGPDENIPCVIFAQKSQPAINTINFMKNLTGSGKIPPGELPDMVFTIDNGIIYHTLDIEGSIFNSWANQGSEVHSGEKYLHFKTQSEMNLAMFLIILLCFKGPELMMSDHIIKDYLNLGFCETGVPFRIY